MISNISGFPESKELVHKNLSFDFRLFSLTI